MNGIQKIINEHGGVIVAVIGTVVIVGLLYLFGSEDGALAKQIGEQITSLGGLIK